MITAKFSGSSTTTAYGLTQWDYGQELVIECAAIIIPDGTEVQFFQGKLSSTAYIISNHVLIPDIMLQVADNIVAYIYVRGERSGETILSIRLPINTRPRPENYVLPEYKDYARLIPPGGTSGQALIKGSEQDYETEWATVEALQEPLTDEDIDKICV